MALELWAISLAFATNLLVGGVLVVAVYSLMEQRIFLGAVGGLVLAGVIVWSEATVGQMLWDLTFEEKRSIVLAAGLGAALGIVGTMTMLKPEIE